MVLRFPRVPLQPLSAVSLKTTSARWSSPPLTNCDHAQSTLWCSVITQSLRASQTNQDQTHSNNQSNRRHFHQTPPTRNVRTLAQPFAQVVRVCEGVWTKPQRRSDGSVRVRTTSSLDQCANANMHTHTSRTKENQMNSIAPSNWLRTIAHNPDFRFSSTKTMALFAGHCLA